MAEMAAWNGHVFTVSPTVIRSFTGLTINGSVELDEQVSDGQKYVVRANSAPTEISLDAKLNAMMGIDVNSEAMAFVADANAGEKDFFYLAGKKLLGCMMMLVKADVTEVEIAPSGAWVSCTVKLTLRQCSKRDGTLAVASSKVSVKGQQTSIPFTKLPITTQEKIIKDGLNAALEVVKNSKTQSSKAMTKKNIFINNMAKKTMSYFNDNK